MFIITSVIGVIDYTKITARRRTKVAATTKYARNWKMGENVT